MAQIVSLMGREHERAVLELLRLSRDGRGDESDAAAAEYATREQFGLWGYEEDGRLLGIAGIEWSDDGHARLADLAVDAGERRRGIGRRLVEHVCIVLQPRSAAGAATAESAPFFEHCGFAVRPFGRWPSGAPRFGVTWTPGGRAPERG